jgi:hypothetical protein
MRSLKLALCLVAVAWLAADPPSVLAANQSRNSPVDLVQTSLIVPGKVKIGKKFRILDEVESAGESPAGNTVTYFYLSADDTIDRFDTVVGARRSPQLSPGRNSAEYTEMTIPATVAPGPYYLIALANATKAFEERYLENNIRATKFTVQPADDKK